MTIYDFQVSPSLPPELEGLNRLAYNLLWCWNDGIIDMFRSLDADLWDEVRHNPVLFLGSVDRNKLQEAVNDDKFIARYKQTLDRYERYFNRRAWYDEIYKDGDNNLVAYFSPEFGLVSCLPIYAGGLGILAGDHIKSASDLGIPLVGVGLLYQQGFFRQYLNADGWQQESYPTNDFYNMPVIPIEDDSGEPVVVSVPYPEGEVAAQIWRVNVGRITIYLLDTNIPENQLPESRSITDRLYGGGTEKRLRQEILLGIGGVRALKTLGVKPTAYHMNEGHAAFLALERCRKIMNDDGLSFDEARILVGNSSLFTTHTPVPAGIDTFAPDLVVEYFSWLFEEINISQRDFLALGRRNPDDDGEKFNMAYLATRFAYYCNGVSELHGEVTRKLWRDRWPGLPTDEVPITSVTNGIHTATWVSDEMTGLYDNYLGDNWREKPNDNRTWEPIAGIPPGELWAIHEESRRALVSYVRSKPKAISDALDPDVLTIGFARRFATYKRATLLFADTERLKRLVSNEDRPVQFVFAGKAHPDDDAGKEFIRKIIHTIRDPQIKPHVVFLEDYDISVARKLVSGVDVWLNTPRRPREACGTSGMKAAVNGVLNLSVLDGWWDEGYSPDVGWTIGEGEIYDDYTHQDSVESQTVYDLIEGEIASLFYKRNADGIPVGWTEMMKRSIAELASRFSCARMVAEYTARFYIPASANGNSLSADDFAVTRRLAAWEKRIRSEWPGIAIKEVKPTHNGELELGENIEVRAEVELGGLSPEDVLVQVYYGAMDGSGNIIDGSTADMTVAGDNAKNIFTYTAEIVCSLSGRNGYTARILPYNPAVSVYDLGLIKWFE
ncbi:MAG: glycosyltransferase family 1 protein [bacterium]|nr:glycosyltransferase family 1 protein [bacterium]